MVPYSVVASSVTGEKVQEAEKAAEPQARTACKGQGGRQRLCLRCPELLHQGFWLLVLCLGT
jgi:hypothetical protein